MTEIDLSMAHECVNGFAVDGERDEFGLMPVTVTIGGLTEAAGGDFKLGEYRVGGHEFVLMKGPGRYVSVTDGQGNPVHTGRAVFLAGDVSGGCTRLRALTAQETAALTRASVIRRVTPPNGSAYRTYIVRGAVPCRS